MRKRLLVGLAFTLLSDAPATNSGSLEDVFKNPVFDQELLMRDGWEYMMDIDAFHYHYRDEDGVYRVRTTQEPITVEQATQAFGEYFKKRNNFTLLRKDDDTLMLYIKKKPLPNGKDDV